jgi:hypothetical protein
MIPAPGERPGEWWENTGQASAIADALARHGPISTWDAAALHDVFLHDVLPRA